MKKERANFFRIRRRGKRPPGLLLHVHNGISTAWPSEPASSKYASIDDILLSPFLPQTPTEDDLDAAAEDSVVLFKSRDGLAMSARNSPRMSRKTAARFASALGGSGSTEHADDGNCKNYGAGPATGSEPVSPSTSSSRSSLPPPPPTFSSASFASSSPSLPPRRVLQLDADYSICANDDDECSTPLAMPTPLTPSGHEYAEVADVKPALPHVYVAMQCPGEPASAELDDYDAVTAPPLLQQNATPAHSFRDRTSTYDSAAGNVPAAAAAAAAVHDYAEIAELSSAASVGLAPKHASAGVERDYAEIDEVVASPLAVAVGGRAPTGAVYVGGSSPGAVAAAAAVAAVAARSAVVEYSNAGESTLLDYRPARTAAGEYAEIDDAVTAAAAAATAAIGIVDLVALGFATTPDVGTCIAGDATLTIANNSMVTQFPDLPIMSTASTGSAETDATLEPPSPPGRPSLALCSSSSSPSSPLGAGKFYSSFGDQSSCKRKPHRPSSPSLQLGTLLRSPRHPTLGEMCTIIQSTTSVPKADTVLETVPWNGRATADGLATKMSYAAAAGQAVRGTKAPAAEAAKGAVGDLNLHLKTSIAAVELKYIVDTMTDQHIEKLVAGFDDVPKTSALSG